MGPTSDKSSQEDPFLYNVVGEKQTKSQRDIQFLHATKTQQVPKASLKVSTLIKHSVFKNIDHILILFRKVTIRQQL